MRDAQWFRVPYGPHAGKLTMAHWGLDAIRTLGTADGDPPVWICWAVCPRCHALVLADEKHPYGDQRWAHEEWHASTDHPIPAELLESS